MSLSISQINHFLMFPSRVSRIWSSQCVSVCSFGTLGFSFSAACLPCLGLTGSGGGGVSWEEICGVIQPGPLQFEYYTKAARWMGIQSQLPVAELLELHTNLELESQRRHRWPVIYLAYTSVFLRQKRMCQSCWQSSRVLVLCILINNTLLRCNPVSTWTW